MDTYFIIKNEPEEETFSFPRSRVANVAINPFAIFKNTQLEQHSIKIEQDSSDFTPNSFFQNNNPLFKLNDIKSELDKKPNLPLSDSKNIMKSSENDFERLNIEPKTPELISLISDDEQDELLEPDIPTGLNFYHKVPKSEKDNYNISLKRSYNGQENTVQPKKKKETLRVSIPLKNINLDKIVSFRKRFLSIQALEDSNGYKSLKYVSPRVTNPTLTRKVERERVKNIQKLFTEAKQNLKTHKINNIHDEYEHSSRTWWCDYIRSENLRKEPEGEKYLPSRSKAEAMDQAAQAWWFEKREIIVQMKEKKNNPTLKKRIGVYGREMEELLSSESEDSSDYESDSIHSPETKDPIYLDLAYAMHMSRATMELPYKSENWECMDHWPKYAPLMVKYIRRTQNSCSSRVILCNNMQAYTAIDMCNRASGILSRKIGMDFFDLLDFDAGGCFDEEIFKREERSYLLTYLLSLHAWRRITLGNNPCFICVFTSIFSYLNYLLKDNPKGPISVQYNDVVNNEDDYGVVKIELSEEKFARFWNNIHVCGSLVAMENISSQRKCFKMCMACLRNSVKEHCTPVEL